MSIHACASAQAHDELHVFGFVIYDTCTSSSGILRLCRNPSITQCRLLLPCMACLQFAISGWGLHAHDTTCLFPDACRHCETVTTGLRPLPQVRVPSSTPLPTLGGVPWPPIRRVQGAGTLLPHPLQLHPHRISSKLHHIRRMLSSSLSSSSSLNTSSTKVSNSSSRLLGAQRVLLRSESCIICPYACFLHPCKAQLWFA